MVVYSVSSYVKRRVVVQLNSRGMAAIRIGRNSVDSIYHHCRNPYPRDLSRYLLARGESFKNSRTSDI